MKEKVVKIVAAFVGHNTIAPEGLPVLITSVNAALAALGQTPAVASEAPVPAVPMRHSAGRNAITCLECGWSGQMLKRHLTTAHDTTPGQYRERWRLRPDYPIVARNYAARRAELAKAIGLGTRGNRTGAQLK